MSTEPQCGSVLLRHRDLGMPGELRCPRSRAVGEVRIVDLARGCGSGPRVASDSGTPVAPVIALRCRTPAATVTAASTALCARQSDMCIAEHGENRAHFCLSPSVVLPIHFAPSRVGLECLERGVDSGQIPYAPFSISTSASTNAVSISAVGSALPLWRAHQPNRLLVRPVATTTARSQRHCAPRRSPGHLLDHLSLIFRLSRWWGGRMLIEMAPCQAPAPAGYQIAPERLRGAARRANSPSSPPVASTHSRSVTSRSGHDPWYLAHSAFSCCFSRATAFILAAHGAD